MHIQRAHRRTSGATLAVLLLAAGATTATAETHYGVQEGKVTVRCPLTVGGSFKAKTKALTGDLARDDSGAVTGQLTVDLATLETGINLRDRHLRENYLEVGNGDGFAQAVLSELSLSGDAATSLDGKLIFTATLALHGIAKPVTGEATLSSSGDAVEVVASFPVNLKDYDIKKPRHLGIGVKDTVDIEVRVKLAATAAATAEGES